jgi:nitroreductase
MDLREVMTTTPSTRAFTADPVPDDVLHRILDAARFAPSGGNRQGWRLIVVKDPDTRHRIRDLYELGWREYMGYAREGKVPFAASADGRWHGPEVDLDAARATPAPLPFDPDLAEVPVMLVLVADLTALATVDNGLDRQSIIGGASVYPFAHNVLLASRNEGLGGIITTVLARQEPAVKELLHIPDGHAVAALVALGTPQKRITKLKRAAVEDFTVVDAFDGEAFTA